MADTSSQSAEVVKIPQREPPQPNVSNALLLVATLKDILNARLLAVLALVGALGIFGWTIGDPTSLRLWGCAGYSVGILWPVIWLYLKKGD